MRKYESKSQSMNNQITRNRDTYEFKTMEKENETIAWFKERFNQIMIFLYNLERTLSWTGHVKALNVCLCVYSLILWHVFQLV